MPTEISFSGTGFAGVDNSSGVESLGPFANKADVVRVSVAENVRATRDGGLRTRNGYEEEADLALDAAVDDIETHPMFNCLFLKCGTQIRQSLNRETWYTIGVTRTAAEKDFLFPYRKDMFSTNQTDSSLRIAVTTVASVNVAGGTLDVRTGDGSNFGSSGTFYVRGIAVTYTGRSTDQFTGCTGLTAAMAAGDILTETSTPSSFPKGTCIAEIEGSLVVGGVKANPTTLYWSEPSTPANPELAYSFPATYVKSMPSDITALKSGNRVLLIGLKTGLQFSSGFDVTTGVLLTISLSQTHGIPGARCIAQMDEEFCILTNTGRMLPVAQTDAGFSVIQNPDDPRLDMDYPIQGYMQKNLDRQTLDENFIHYDPGTREASGVVRMKTGLTREFIFQRDIRAWTHDTGKNFRCKTIFKNRTLAGDDADSVIYLVDEGWTDNGTAINVRIVTGIMRATRKGITCDYLLHTFGGLLSAIGQFNMRVLLDGTIVENKLYKAVGTSGLITKMLMDVQTGVAVGGGQVGSEQIGSGGQVADAFAFTVPYEFMGEAEQSQIEWETTDEGVIFELRFFDLSGETEGELLLNHT